MNDHQRTEKAKSEEKRKVEESLVLQRGRTTERDLVLSNESEETTETTPDFHSESEVSDKAPTKKVSRFSFAQQMTPKQRKQGSL